MPKQTSKKRTKRKRRNIDIYRVALIIVLVTYDTFMVCVLIAKINIEKNYTYYLNGEFGISNDCYIKNDNAYCVIDEEETKVDLYYEVEK